MLEYLIFSSVLEDAVMFRVFIQTLAGPTYELYMSLSTSSITCFNDIDYAFLMRLFSTSSIPYSSHRFHPYSLGEEQKDLGSQSHIFWSFVENTRR